jgi:nucleoside-diphosphate-sugar epimerase
MQIVVIRPPLVYGPEVNGNFLSLLNFISYSFFLPVLEKNIIRSYVGIDNLVDFIICTIKHPKAAGQTFLISDGKDISLQSLIKFLLEINTVLQILKLKNIISFIFNRSAYANLFL